MMLRYTDRPDKFRPLAAPRKGTVLSNKDPKKLGRLKVSIPGIFEGPQENLPWCSAQAGFGLGGKAGLSGFVVPEEGTEVVVSFPYGDVYFPVYVGKSETTKTHTDRFDEDYPETYGWRDSGGTLLKVNKKQGKVLILHGPSNSTFSLDKSGNLKLVHPGSVDWTAGGPTTFVQKGVTIGFTVNGDIQISNDGGLTWDVGTNVDLTAQGTVSVTSQGDVDLTTLGSFTVSALGGILITMGGMSLAIAADGSLVANLPTGAVFNVGGELLVNGNMSVVGTLQVMGTFILNGKVMT